MKLKIYNNKKNAPKPNQPLLPGSCAVIISEKRKILLIKRNDSPLWSLPGGTMKLGESIGQCCLREVEEEVGIKTTLERLIGIYTSPQCVFEWKVGDKSKVWQSFVVAFLVKSKTKKVKLNNESTEYQWFCSDEIKELKTLPYVKTIIKRGLSDNSGCFFD